MLIGLFYATLAALGIGAGAALVLWRAGRDRRALAAFAGFGAGFMLAVVILGMLPHVVTEATAHNGIEPMGGFVAVLAGYLIVHLTQHSLTPHFHFGEETHSEAMVSRGIGVYALVGLLPHSFFDGVAISSGFIAGPQLGMLIFFSILLHNVPTGVSLSSIMLASGNTRAQTLSAIAAIGGATMLGAAITPLFDTITEYGLPLAAGVTLYVAASNLIPEAQHEHGWQVQGGLFAGVAAYLLLRALMPDIAHG